MNTYYGSVLMLRLLRKKNKYNDMPLQEASERRILNNVTFKNKEVIGKYQVSTKFLNAVFI